MHNLRRLLTLVLAIGLGHAACAVQAAVAVVRPDEDNNPRHRVPFA